MKNQSTRARLLASTIIIGAGLAMAGQALAADTPPPPSSTQVGEIVVTGSRIPMSNVTSPSPISVATSAQIALTNSFSVGDVLTRLAGPDYSGGLSAASNNGGVGLSEIGLRNLGPSRTLILIDGQRLVPIFSGAASVPDLNSVPLSMVDRVEVLRDGASSVYGADAIGGVINVITKKNFEGLQFDSSGGLTQHGGGANWSVGGTIGFNTDKGNLTLSVLHELENPVDQSQRAWAQDPHIGDPNFEGGSVFRSQLNILQDELSHTVWANGVETTYNNPALASLPCLTFLPALNRVKLNAGCPSVSPPQALTSGLERTQISFNGHYNITDNIRFIASGFFTDRHSEQRLRPEPLLGDSIASTYPATGANVYGGFEVPELAAWGFSDPNGTASSVPCTGNASVPCMLAFLTPNEWGPRDYKQTSHTYRIRAGFEGDLPFHDFKWEAGFVNQRNDTNQRIYNGGNWLHLAEETGQIPCTSAPGGCTFNPTFGYATPTTPVNFFHEPNGMTPDQVNYLTYTAIDTNSSYENYAYADINGKLFDLPAGPLQAALGFERRYEHLSDNPDSLVQQGWAAGPTGPTAGGYEVTSVYGELRIPVLAGLPFVEMLSLNPSARWDHYSNFGDAKTYKIGGEWKITQDVRIRGTWAVGFRAPSTAELFGGNAISYISVSGDPCDSRGAAAGPGGVNGNGNANGAASLAPGSACYTSLMAAGVAPGAVATYTSSENNLSNDQRGLILGGNPHLQPEKSNQYNIGIVLTPRFLPGFSFDADYYQVHIHNTIITGGLAGALGPDLIVNGCFVDQNAGYCSLITRNNSGIFQIGSQNTNFGLSAVKGLDMELTYDTAAAGLMLPFPGSLRLDLQAERQFQNNQQNPDGTTSNYNGFFLYSNESVQPKWKGRASLDYKLGTWIFHYDSQWTGHAYNLDGSPAVYGNYIPNYFYHNISMSFDLPNMGPVQRTTMVLGINNLLDKDPPFLGADSICKCNSFAGPYDFYGREFFAKVSAKF